jgi:uncharacterized protein
MEPKGLRATARSTPRRKRVRGSHDRELIYAILDEGLVCHVGFLDEGSVFVVPTTYARIDSDLYVHGAAANAMLSRLASASASESASESVSASSITVTLLDGLVFSRSAFHHSMNFRSVMLFGTGSKVVDEDEKRSAVLAIVDHMAPGRSRDVRAPTSNELRSTSVVRFPIDEGSAKVRVGGPVEEPEDLDLPCWAGQLPLAVTPKSAIPDSGIPERLPLPAYLRPYVRPRAPTESIARTHDCERPGPGG